MFSGLSGLVGCKSFPRFRTFDSLDQEDADFAISLIENGEETHDYRISEF